MKLFSENSMVYSKSLTQILLPKNVTYLKYQLKRIYFQNAFCENFYTTQSIQKNVSIYNKFIDKNKIYKYCKTNTFLSLYAHNLKC